MQLFDILKSINSVCIYFFNFLGKEGIIQIISSLMVVIGALIAYLSTRKKTAIDLITKSRIDWSNTIRNRASEITFLIYKIANMNNLAARVKEETGKDLYNKENILEEFENIHKLNGLMTEFRLYFNPYDQRENEIFRILDEMDLELNKNYTKIDFQKITDLINLFTKNLSILLKLEWEKIKKEAGIKPGKFTS